MRKAIIGLAICFAGVAAGAWSVEKGSPSSPVSNTAPSAATETTASLERHALSIEWPSESRISVDTFESLSQESQQAVRSSSVPVLVPSDRALSTKTAVIAGATWYSASVEYQDISLDISADGVILLAPTEPKALNPPNEAVRGTVGYIYESEGIWRVRWTENGIPYALWLSCGTASDPRCSSSTYVREIVNGLVFVGGKSAQH